MRKMKLNKSWIDNTTINTIILVGVLLAALIFDKWQLGWYCCFVVFTVDTIYYLYEYLVKYREQPSKRMEVLCRIRSQLSSIVLAISVLFALVYLLLDDKTMFMGKPSIIFCVAFVVSSILIILCTKTIKNSKAQKGE